MSDLPAMHYNSDLSKPAPFPVPTAAQKAAFGPFPTASFYDQFLVLTHLLEMEMSQGTPIEAPTEPKNQPSQKGKKS